MFMQTTGGRCKSGGMLSNSCCPYSTVVRSWGIRAIELKGSKSQKELSMHK